MLGSVGFAHAADDADTGRINRGAAEAQMPPSGSPPGGGPGERVDGVPAPMSTPSGATTGMATDVPSGPIGATRQTMPAKYSAENAAKDELPIMAQPLDLTDGQKQLIAKAVAGNPDVFIAGIEAAPAATTLSNDVILHDLPVTVTEQVPAVKGYKFVKLQDKILLVSPPNRTVVGEIAQQ
jgi:hypothetical protein